VRAPEEAVATARELEQACARVVRAPGEVLRAAVACLLAGGHLMVEDVPGVGKTVLARSLARAAGCSFSRVQCTADLLPADVTGTNVWDQGASAFRFRAGPVFANLVLVDEINRASPRTQSALLECMEEHQVTVDGETHRTPEPFMVVATQNPVEHEGTFPLPEAQLDRFSLRVSIGYPPPGVEAAMLRELGERDPVEAVPQVGSPERVARAREAAAEVWVAPELADYVVALLSATRADPRLSLGASPRAGLALIRCAKALALLEGRSYVLPDDVKVLAPMALAHRVVPGPDAELRGVGGDEVVREALASTPIPE
jgi:MoxR-like ATPase